MHGLDFNQDGIARFAFQQKHLNKVWHRHGTQVPEGALTIDDWLDAADMNHTVEQAPLFAVIDGEYVEVPSHKLVYRDSDNQQLSVMGKDYRPVQSREAFGILEELVEGGEIGIDTIGTLKEGRRTFIAASITGDPLEVVPGDVVDSHLLCADSWDGTLALTFASVATLVVCQNTLRAALGEKGRRAKLKHTRGVLDGDRVAQVRAALGIAESDFAKFAALGQSLASVKMSESEILDFHKTLVLGDKRDSALDDWSGQQRRAIGELGWLMTDGPGQEIEGRAGTAWGALNSVTAWVSHVKNHKRDTTTDRTQFVLFGSGNTITERAQSLLVNQYQMAA